MQITSICNNIYLLLAKDMNETTPGCISKCQVQNLTVAGKCALRWSRTAPWFPVLVECLWPQTRNIVPSVQAKLVMDECTETFDQHRVVVLFCRIECVWCKHEPIFDGFISAEQLTNHVTVEIQLEGHFLSFRTMEISRVWWAGSFHPTKLGPCQKPWIHGPLIELRGSC